MADTQPIPLLECLAKKHAKWDRIEALITDDETAFGKEPFCEKLPNETGPEYEERSKSFVTSFINPTQSMISAPGAAVFGNGVHVEPTGSVMEKFCENCIRANDQLPFVQYVRDHVSTMLRAYGTVFTLVDKPRNPAISLKDEIANGMPYLVNIRPQDVLNYRLYDGELYWFAYRSAVGPHWEDPLMPGPEQRAVECVWTRQDFIVRDVQDSHKVLVEYSFRHGFGFVPVVIQASFVPELVDVLGVAAFEQTSRMLIKFNTRLGLANYELDKHGKSLLALHEDTVSGMNMGEDAKGNTVEKRQGKGNVFIWSGKEKPEYIVKELVIKEHMDVAQYFLSNAFDNERDLRSVSKKSSPVDEDRGPVAQSGFAKMVDREPLEHNLISLADDCEAYAGKIDKVVRGIMRDTAGKLIFQCDKDYDLKGIEAKLSAIKEAAASGVKKMSETMYREMWKAVVPDVTDDLELQATIVEEIDTADMTDDAMFAAVMKAEEDASTGELGPDGKPKKPFPPAKGKPGFWNKEEKE